MIDEKRIKRFIEGAKEAFKKVDDPTFTFPMNILSAYELATSIEELLKEHESKPDKCIICEGCGHKLQDNWNLCPWCGWETARGRRVKSDGF